MPAPGRLADRERPQTFDMMSTLKLYGMRSAYDEIMASGIKRQHEPPRIVGDLTRRSMKDWCASLRAELSLPSSTISFSLEELALGNPICPSRLPVP